MDTDNFIIKCTNCGTKNRISKNRINDQPVCGKCHTILSIGGYDSPVIVTDQTFQEDVISYPGPVLLDCWAPWCGPCRMIAPILEQLAKEYAGRIKIAKLNVDENPLTASKFAIKSIPTMLLFKNGERVNTLVGALSKSEIEKQLNSIL
jgi:thioredoxin 2